MKIALEIGLIILSFICIATGTYLLAKIIQAVAEGYFIRNCFDKAIGLSLLAGIFALVMRSPISKLEFILTVVLVFVSGVWVYYHVLIVGNSLTTFIFYEIELGAVTWILAGVAFFRIKLFRTRFLVFFFFGTSICTLLSMGPFTFGHLHDGLHLATLVWTLVGTFQLFHSAFAFATKGLKHQAS